MQRPYRHLARDPASAAANSQRLEATGTAHARCSTRLKPSRLPSARPERHHTRDTEASQRAPRGRQTLRQHTRAHWQRPTATSPTRSALRTHRLGRALPAGEGAKPVDCAAHNAERAAHALGSLASAVREGIRRQQAGQRSRAGKDTGPRRHNQELPASGANTPDVYVCHRARAPWGP
jgi:hypothetical protein